jgi:predicted flavoprotein YhiN
MRTDDDSGAAPVVVVGAGAAGLMAAIHAAEGGRPVVLLERTADGGRKILISGGGRCNVLPSRLTPSRFVTESSPNTLRKMLLSWPLAEQRAFFERRMGLALELEEETGKLFPATNRARDVRDGLVRLAREAGVEIRFGVRVAGLDAVASSAVRWTVRCDDGAPAIPAHAVVLATGGLSVPATGSDGVGLRIAGALGHTVHATYPALTPLTADPPVHAPLAGISLSVALTAPLKKGALTTEGGFLFTHRGYSGPAVLDVSHVAVRAKLQADGDAAAAARGRGDAGGARPGRSHSVDARPGRGDSVDAPPGRGEAGGAGAGGGGATSGSAGSARYPPQAILVRWTEHDAAALEGMLIGTGGGTVGAVVRRLLPQRLADALLGEADVPSDTPLSQLRKDARARLVAILTRYALPWSGDEGYRKAEVTGGGVALGEVDPRTLESRRHPGLHLCGEMLDAFGPIGGYNFAWAFATGRLAGLGAAAGAGGRRRG